MKVKSMKEIGIQRNKYIILFNDEFFSMDDMNSLPRGYKLHSFISFEHLFLDLSRQTEINHFVCCTLTDELAFVYDDLISIKPGTNMIDFFCEQVQFNRRLARCRSSKR
jgi:hypothetical protein